MWMNADEVDEAVRRINAPVYMAEAALYLAAFKDLIDSISDGWHTWRHGTKCADDLCAVIREYAFPYGALLASKRAPTQEQVGEVCAKIRRFLQRNKHTKAHPAVIEFLQRPVFGVKGGTAVHKTRADYARGRKAFLNALMDEAGVLMRQPETPEDDEAELRAVAARLHDIAETHRPREVV